MQIEDNNSTISERVKDLRKDFRFSRKYLSDRYGIPQITLQKIENSERKITEQSLHKIINIYKSDNILVTREWILNGTGEKPRYIFPDNPITDNFLQDFIDKDELAINREIEFFEKNNPNSKVIILEDNDMAPYYKKGDYVGGIEISSEKYENLSSIDCIVLVKGQNSYLLRTVDIDDENTFRLSIKNRKSNNMKPVIYKANIIYAAPIVWIRKKLKNK